MSPGKKCYVVIKTNVRPVSALRWRILQRATLNVKQIMSMPYDETRSLEPGLAMRFQLNRRENVC